MSQLQTKATAHDQACQRKNNQASNDRLNDSHHYLLDADSPNADRSHHPVLLVLIAFLASWLFSAFGLTIGTVADPQQIGLVFNVLIAPMIMFGCAYYPWTALKVVPIVQKLVLINPLVYASEGFRAALTSQLPHMPLWLIFGGLLGFCLLFTYLGLRQFGRRAVD